MRARSTGFWGDFARDLGVKKTQIAVEADPSTQVERNGETTVPLKNDSVVRRLPGRARAPFAKNSKSHAPGAHSPRARSEGEKHDARARGLERRRHARLALQQTAQSDQDAHPGRGQGAPGACRPERNARPLPGVLKVDAQSIIVVRGPRWDPPRNEARAQSRPPRAVSGFARARFHPRARPRATALLRVATFIRALTTSPLFSRFCHSSANTNECREREPPTERAFDRVGGF